MQQTAAPVSRTICDSPPASQAARQGRIRLPIVRSDELIDLARQSVINDQVPSRQRLPPLAPTATSRPRGQGGGRRHPSRRLPDGPVVSRRHATRSPLRSALRHGRYRAIAIAPPPGTGAYLCSTGSTARAQPPHRPELAAPRPREPTKPSDSDKTLRLRLTPTPTKPSDSD